MAAIIPIKDLQALEAIEDESYVEEGQAAFDKFERNEVIFWEELESELEPNRKKLKCQQLLQQLLKNCLKK